MNPTQAIGRARTLGEFIIQQQAQFPYAKGELSNLLASIILGAKIVSSEINKAGLVEEIMGAAGSENIQGETQQKLDVFANKIFIEAMECRYEVCGVASEENEKEIIFQREESKNGKYVLTIDPLDGSSNIDVNVSTGTIFSIYRRISEIGTKVTQEDFLQPGHKQVAAGYVLYGSSTMIVYSTGNNRVDGFTLDPAAGVFFHSFKNIKTPNTGPYFSLNEGHYIDFPEGIRKYVEYCKDRNPAENRPYSARYTGSLVADFHRNMLKGGVYLYPEVVKYPNGKLRLLYECNPLAFLAENSGGIATSGKERILDIKPTELHQRIPFITGSKDMVEKVLEFHKP